MIWNMYPYTDYHNLNLDWVLKTLKSIVDEMNNFTLMNKIKYADPLDWDITKQYEANTVVVDPSTYIAYISVKPVPHGAAITNTDYWTVIFDLSTFMNDIDSRVTNNTDRLNIIEPIVSLLGRIYDTEHVVNVLCPPQADDEPLVADWVSASSYTDNTTRFQTLINKYGAGTTYYFPAGVYGFSNGVTIPYNQIKIVGNGNRYTRLHFNNAGGGTFISLGDTTAMNGLLAVEKIGFVCDDVTGSVNAIKLNNPRTCRFDDILFIDFTNDVFYDAIVASSGQTSIFNWLNHSTVNRTGMNRMFYFNRASNMIFPNGIIIENCHGSFLSTGRFIEGYAADIWVSHCNIAYCVNSIWLTAGNEDVSGDVHIIDNVFADCVGHAIYLKHFNRGIMISGNMIEQHANHTNVFAAFRVGDCNGVIINANTVGTERTSIPNHFIGFILTEGALCKDFVITNNAGYLGAYILSTSGPTKDVTIANNFFAHVGSNATQANAFYISQLSEANIHDNRFKTFSALNSAYSISNFFDKDNIYEAVTTVNTPFTAANNHAIS